MGDADGSGNEFCGTVPARRPPRARPRAAGAAMHTVARDGVLSVRLAMHTIRGASAAPAAPSDVQVQVQTHHAAAADDDGNSNTCTRGRVVSKLLAELTRVPNLLVSLA